MSSSGNYCLYLLCRSENVRLLIEGSVAHMAKEIVVGSELAYVLICSNEGCCK